MSIQFTPMCMFANNIYREVGIIGEGFFQLVSPPKGIKEQVFNQEILVLLICTTQEGCSHKGEVFISPHLKFHHVQNILRSTYK